MGKIISIVNQKGGVGKTTTAVNLTATLHDLGLRVLLCDFDPQANATSGMGISKRKLKKSVYDVVINGEDTQSAIVSTPYGDVLPSTGELAGAAVELISMEDRSYRLAKALEKVKDQYDVIFIDCPPSLEMLTVKQHSGAGTVRVFRSGRSVRSDVYPPVRQEKDEPHSGDLRRGADHVRRTDKLLRPGCPGSSQVFPRQSVRHSRTPECASGGGTQPRRSRDCV